MQIPTPETNQVEESCCNKIFNVPSWSLFPHDFSFINGIGIYCMTQKVSTTFRIVSMLCMIAMLAYCSLFFHPKDLLYFTTWGLVLTTFTYFMLALENVLNYCLRHKTRLRYWKVSHFLFTISLFFQIFINAVYWLGLFPYAVLNLWGTLGLVDILNPFLAHGGPLIVLVIDFQINPVNIWNFGFIPYYAGILIIYLVVNAVYSVRVSAVYQLISFNNWITAVLIIGCVGAVLLVHLIIRIFCKYYKEKRVLALLETSKDPSVKATAESTGIQLNVQDQVSNLKMTPMSSSLKNQKSEQNSVVTIK